MATNPFPLEHTNLTCIVRTGGVYDPGGYVSIILNPDTKQVTLQYVDESGNRYGDYESHEEIYTGECTWGSTSKVQMRFTNKRIVDKSWCDGNCPDYDHADSYPPTRKESSSAVEISYDLVQQAQRGAGYRIGSRKGSGSIHFLESMQFPSSRCK
eukprot:SAG31_NODE_3806_length_3866_cov_1.907619_4_plen_155_part_00